MLVVDQNSNVHELRPVYPSLTWASLLWALAMIATLAMLAVLLFIGYGIWTAVRKPDVPTLAKPCPMMVVPGPAVGDELPSVKTNEHE